MSETSTQNTEAAAPPKKGGKKKLLIIIVLVVLLAGGGGGGYYFWRASSAAAAENGKPEKKGKKGQSKDEEPGSDEKAEGEDHAKPNDSSLPDDQNVKAVVELPPFIVNLADTAQARYLRMTVSLGIDGGEGGESEKPDQLFITRVRNAMLAVLAEKKSEDVLNAEGKAKLRKELLSAAQAASEEPHVQAIYITDFIVQL